jgi:hypothetical protein
MSQIVVTVGVGINVGVDVALVRTSSHSLPSNRAPRARLPKSLWEL